MTYEPGSGESQADQYWFCAWVDEAIAAPTDRRRLRALAVLPGVRATVFYRTALRQPDLGRFDRSLAAMRSGDRGSLTSYRAGCPPLRRIGASGR
jgi:hypothetical protein